MYPSPPVGVLVRVRDLPLYSPRRVSSSPETLLESGAVRLTGGVAMCVGPRRLEVEVFGPDHQPPSIYEVLETDLVRSLYRPGPIAIVGQAAPQRPPTPTLPEPPPATPTKTEEVTVFNIQGLTGALKQITPALLLVGIATGAAFAIGSGLVNRYVWKGK